jgi:ABC-type transport system substrate-binding protein
VPETNLYRDCKKNGPLPHWRGQGHAEQTGDSAQRDLDQGRLTRFHKDCIQAGSPPAFCCGDCPLLGASLTPQPQMFEGHELSEDRLTWRFSLREGLRFHDGEPVPARDAVASIGRWAQRAPLGVSMKKQLDEIRAIDDRRFEIQLKKPFPHLLYGLGRAVDCVVRPERT